MFAASSGRAKAVALLLAAGADPLFETDLGLTALDMASSVECLDLMRAAIRRKKALQLSPAIRRTRTERSGRGDAERRCGRYCRHARRRMLSHRFPANWLAVFDLAVRLLRRRLRRGRGRTARRRSRRARQQG